MLLLYLLKTIIRCSVAFSCSECLVFFRNGSYLGLFFCYRSALSGLDRKLSEILLCYENEYYLQTIQNTHIIIRQSLTLNAKLSLKIFHA